MIRRAAAAILGALRHPLVRAGAWVGGFVAFAAAFDWRNCAVSRTSPTLDQLFVPPDAWIGGYSADRLAAAFGALEPAGRSLYAWSQWTLDLAFPVFYGVALTLALATVWPKPSRWRRWLLLLPAIGALADVIENALLAWLAASGGSASLAVGFASSMTVTKWTVLIAALVLIVFAALFLNRRHARQWLLHIVFARVPLLLAGLTLVLASLGRRSACEHPASGPVGLPTVQNLLSVENDIQFFYGAAFIVLGAAVVLFCTTHLWRLAAPRIGIERLGLDAQAPDNWTSRCLFGAGTLALACPLLARLIVDGEGGNWRMLLLGLLTAIGALTLVILLRDVLVGRHRGPRNGGWAARARSRASDWFEAPISKAMHSLFGPGIDMLDNDGRPTGRMYRGHALAGAVALLFLTAYSLGAIALNPIRALPDLLDVPPISYLMLLLASICLLFSALTFLFDRLRLPILLVMVGWMALWGNLPASWYNTQHYFDVTIVDEGGDAPPTIAEAFYARARAQGEGPIVVVAAAGGGIQAAGWSAVVLDGLQRAIGREFTDSIYLISGTSGGSVGTFFAVEALRAEALATPAAAAADPSRSLTRDRYAGFQMLTDDVPAALPLRPDYLGQAPKAAMASSLEATAWGLAFPDFLRLTLPFVVLDTPAITARDRAWAIEQAWHRWRSCMVTDTTVYHDDMERNPDCRQALSMSPPPARLSDWWAGARDGSLPGVILNGTIIEDGEQFMASSLDLRALDLARDPDTAFALPGNWVLGGFDPALCEHYPPREAARPRSRTDASPPRLAKDGMRINRADPCDPPLHFIDMRAVTAARLSATFPYVTPVARARIRRDDTDYEGGERYADTDIGAALAEAPAWHVGDGGYFDNPGSLAVIRWIEEIRRLQRNDEAIAVRDILFVQITPFPARAERTLPSDGQGWQAALLGPLRAMLSVRTSSQLARSDLELSLLRGLFGERFQAVEFRPGPDPDRGDPPLSWELSSEDRARLRRDWCDPRNVAIVDDLATRFFNGRRAACESGQAPASEQPDGGDRPPER